MLGSYFSDLYREGLDEKMFCLFSFWLFSFFDKVVVRDRVNIFEIGIVECEEGC